MITLKEAEIAIQNRIAFTSGNLNGFWVATENSNAYGGARYVVTSYGLSIGSFDYNGDVWILEKKYSATTSKHVNIVKRAWGVN